MNLRTPLTKDDLKGLRVGDEVTITGKIYTARDQAHKMIKDLHQNGLPMPFDMKGALIYYAGPSACPPGFAVGSVGPTTSSRMDPYTRMIFELGAIAVMGKGPRSAEVIEAIKDYGTVYLAALGGAGALLATKVEKCEVVAFPELGPEAVYCLTVADFPALVAVDCEGKDIYKNR